MELDIVCTCGVEGVREVEARRMRIFHRMGLDDMDELHTAIILSLAFDFQAKAYICADMWFGVDVESPLLEGGIGIQCDCPWDGLAAIWEHLATQFPDRVQVKPDPRAMCVRATGRISAALFSIYETAEAGYRAHRTAHKDERDWCEDCEVLQSLSIIAHRTLDEAWGSDVLDEAVKQAFGE